jgi:peptidoglycan hydrolase-like protein with peptidoglycan-binding domain
MADIQNGLQRCAQARQFIKSARAMKGSKSLVMKAVELYRSVIEDFGQDLAEPYWGMAYIAYAGGRPDIALAFLKAGLQLDPGHARMRQLLPRAVKSSAQREERLDAHAKQPQARAAETSPVEPEGPPPNQLISDLGMDNSPATVHRGAEVAMLQRALRKLGHTLMISEIFDRPTYAAVRGVQSLHKLAVTGWVDAATREYLNPIVEVVLAEQAAHDALQEIIRELMDQLQLEANAFQAQMITEFIDLLLEQVQSFPEDEEEEDKSPDAEIKPRVPLSSRLGNMGQMGIVSKGLEVYRTQQVLIKMGYPVKSSGQFDLQTFSELSRFQMDQKLGISGIVEGPTRDRLNTLLEPIFHEEAACEKILQTIREFQQILQLKKWPSVEARREALTDVLIAIVKTAKLPDIPPVILNFFKLTESLGPANRAGQVSQGREVRLLQQVLYKLGYQKVQINGTYDNDTYGAVRSFQISKKLAMTGMVDEKTREELNSLVLDVLSRNG